MRATTTIARPQFPGGNMEWPPYPAFRQGVKIIKPDCDKHRRCPGHKHLKMSA